MSSVSCLFLNSHILYLERGGGGDRSGASYNDLYWEAQPKSAPLSGIAIPFLFLFLFLFFSTFDIDKLRKPPGRTF